MQEVRQASFGGRNRKRDRQADGSHMGRAQAIQVSGLCVRTLEFVLLLLVCAKKTSREKQRIGNVF